MVGACGRGPPLIGIERGVGVFRRVPESLGELAHAGFVIAIASVLLFLFATPLIGMFTKDSEIISVGIVQVFLRHLRSG